MKHEAQLPKSNWVPGEQKNKIDTVIEAESGEEESSILHNNLKSK